MLLYANSARICTRDFNFQARGEDQRTHPLLEKLPLLERERIALGNDGYDVDDLAQLLHDNDIDGLEGMTGRCDKVETAVNTSILNVAISHCGELFAEVGGMLVFDVFDDGFPAVFYRWLSTLEGGDKQTHHPSLLI